jgi:hypothetical protein
MILKEIVKQVVAELVNEGKTEFAADEIYDRASKIEPDVKRYSLFSIIQGLSKGSHLATIKEEERFLEKIGRGRYRIAPPPPPPAPKKALRAISRRARG